METEKVERADAEPGVVYQVHQEVNQVANRRSKSAKLHRNEDSKRTKSPYFSVFSGAMGNVCS